MSTLTICICFLVLSASFALISLGIFLLRAAKAVTGVNELTGDLQTTTTKVNVAMDDVNYKLEKLNAPVEVVNAFFEKKKNRPGIIGTIRNMFEMVFGPRSE